jgi:hypothetical protein
MEKEIKELKAQRDLAQSRLQDLLQVVGDNHVSKRPLVYALPYFLVNLFNCCVMTINMLFLSLMYM